MVMELVDCITHLDTLPGYMWGTHIALDIYSNSGMFPLVSHGLSHVVSGMSNEMFYAILLLRQAYVTVLFKCAYVQNEYYTRKMNYDAMWLLMRTTVFSILMMPICYSYYIIAFSYSYSVILLLSSTSVATKLTSTSSK